LSFFRHAALVTPLAWSHTSLYARVVTALPGEKNPALKNALAGYINLLSELPNFVIFGSGRTKATPWRAPAREVAASFELGQIG